MHTQEKKNVKRNVGVAHPKVHEQGKDIKVKVNIQNLIHTSFSQQSKEVGRDFVHVFYYVVALHSTALIFGVYKIAN